VIAGFLADEEYGFDFLFSFSSSHGKLKGSEFRGEGSEAGTLEPGVIHDCRVNPGIAPGDRDRRWRRSPVPGFMREFADK
jgi:hypothetical protein